MYIYIYIYIHIYIYREREREREREYMSSHGGGPARPPHRGRRAPEEEDGGEHNMYV